MSFFVCFKKKIHEGDYIGIIYQGQTHYGTVLEKGTAQVSDYSITIETGEGAKMIFPVTREMAFILAAEEEVTTEEKEPESDPEAIPDAPEDIEPEKEVEKPRGPHEPKD
jgi:hypothetical protein